MKLPIKVWIFVFLTVLGDGVLSAQTRRLVTDDKGYEKIELPVSIDGEQLMAINVAFKDYSEGYKKYLKEDLNANLYIIEISNSPDGESYDIWIRYKLIIDVRQMGGGARYQIQKGRLRIISSEHFM